MKGLSAFHTDTGTVHLNVLLLFEGLLTPELSDPTTLYIILKLRSLSFHQICHDMELVYKVH